MIHESNAGSPYSRTVVGCSRDECLDSSIAFVEEGGEGLFTDSPGVGIEREKAWFVTARHESGIFISRHNSLARGLRA